MDTGWPLATAKLEEASSSDRGGTIEGNSSQEGLERIVEAHCRDLMKLLGFAKDENHLFFKMGHRQLTSGCLPGSFRIMIWCCPKNNDKLVPLKAEKINSGNKKGGFDGRRAKPRREVRIEQRED